MRSETEELKYVSVRICDPGPQTMHISNQKITFDIFTVGHLLNIFMEHDLYLIS